MSKAKTIVITAHGTIEPHNKIALPLPLYTSCKFGEVHCGNFVKFNELSMFKSPNLLYDYVFYGKDYTSQGEYKAENTPISNIVLTPLDRAIQNWSWQQPFVVNHLKKTCLYELKNIPNNHYHNIDSTDCKQINLDAIKAEVLRINFFPLANRIDLIEDYLDYTNNYGGQTFNIGRGHMCSITSSTNGRVHIFDYEMGPSLCGIVPTNSDNWNVLDAINDIRNFNMSGQIDLSGVESIMLKTCLLS